jgi:triosephosphate isomerase (TIM)
MVRPIIAGNWKMNKTIAESVDFVARLHSMYRTPPDREVIIAPPFTALSAVAAAIRGSFIRLAAQNLHEAEKGAYTGEISPLMLKGICRYCIIGHSERRQYFHDTDEVVNKKLRAALKADIIPILCVGERLEEKESGQAQNVIARQLDSALSGLPGTIGIVIAYEPIWSIGTGRSATSEQANETIGFIRQEIKDILSDNAADITRILYGGSVTPENIAGFVSQPDIDGALVGGASLKPEQFIDIVRRTTAARSC